MFRVIDKFNKKRMFPLYKKVCKEKCGEDFLKENNCSFETCPFIKR